jgi:hypothetical protein
MDEVKFVIIYDQDNEEFCEAPLIPSLNLDSVLGKNQSNKIIDTGVS